MKRVYLPVDLWEEIRANMWGDVADRESALALAIEVTGDHEQYGALMMRVIHEWPNSTLNALTDLSINRKAWIGHAAMALGHGIPEDIVRKAWGELTNEQRRLANNQAENAIQTWYASHLKGEPVHSDLGRQMLFTWDSGGGADVVGKNA